MNTCVKCGHDAINHFVLGTKCSIPGCECRNSQRQIILDDGTATIEKQAQTITEMLAALESLFENCSMIHTHWGDGDNSKQADKAIADARAAIARAKGE